MAERIDPRQLAWLIGLESGWRPDAINPVSEAAGLIQFMPATLAAMGAPPSRKMVKMTRRQQAYWVARYFSGSGKRIAWPGDVYLAVFYPEALTQGDTWVIAAPGTLIWQQNRGLREPGDGAITAGSVRAIGIPPTSGGPSLAWVMEPLPPEPKKSPSMLGMMILILPVVPLMAVLARKLKR